MKTSSALLAATLFSLPAVADWQLDNEMSAVHFISTKNEHISEVHQFTALAGSLNDQGEFNLDIDLSSVSTGIDIRNERMKKELFNIALYPKASLSAMLPDAVRNLAVGARTRQTIAFDLKLHGLSQALQAEVMVTRLSDKELQATSIKPILINANQFELGSGVDTLKQLAGLGSIGLTVPVTFNLSLVQ